MSTSKPVLLLVLGSALAAGCQPSGPDTNETESAVKAEPAQAAGKATIARGLSEGGEHRRFLEAVEAAGLMPTLEGAGPYTVFAPTDRAIAALPQDRRAALAAPERRGELVSLLSYHVVPGAVTAEDLGRAIERSEGGQAELATVTGANLGVVRDGDSLVLIDGSGGRARITGADRIGSNGIVHSVDAVLMPAAE